jgi:surface protein
MIGMFEGCSSLSSLPDISKWNTNNAIHISYMFFKCLSLSSLPNISKWNTNNVKNLSGMFDGCSNIIISKIIKKKFNL